MARSFAEAVSSRYRGGAALLRATVSATATVANVRELSPDAGEAEVIVDRRRLRGVPVEVVRRFPAALAP